MVGSFHFRTIKYLSTSPKWKEPVALMRFLLPFLPTALVAGRSGGAAPAGVPSSIHDAFYTEGLKNLLDIDLHASPVIFSKNTTKSPLDGSKIDEKTGHRTFFPFWEPRAQDYYEPLRDFSGEPRTEEEWLGPYKTQLPTYDRV